MRNARKVRLFSFIPILGMLTFLSCGTGGKPDTESVAIREEPSSFAFLAECYPDFILDADEEYLIWKSGERMALYDSVEGKTPDQLLEAPDFSDQFTYNYTVGEPKAPPLPGHDPGRIRFDPFFKKMYGATRNEVEENLVKIQWMSGKNARQILVTRVNGVDRKLQAISRELDRLPDPYRKYLTDIGGTYNWRFIKGTQRLSAHSFGIAIDLNVPSGDYWLWDREPGMKLVYRNRIPWEIVEVFERHGFIWGGKWYHYDTMHFEYRPELLAQRK